MDVTDRTERFASQREAFDAEIAKFGDKNPKAVAASSEERAQLDDDVTKMFGPAFAESILKWTTADMRNPGEPRIAPALSVPEPAGETDEQMTGRRVEQAKPTCRSPSTR